MQPRERAFDDPASSVATERSPILWCGTGREAKSAVVSGIEGWYNREPLHSTLGSLWLPYMSPVEFEAQIATKTN